MEKENTKNNKNMSKLIAFACVLGLWTGTLAFISFFGIGIGRVQTPSEYCLVKAPQPVQKIDEKILERNKRFVYMTSNRTLALPPGSVFALSGVASLPFLGNLPTGYGSGLTISIPLRVKFDDLGLTSEENRFGYLDFFNWNIFGTNDEEGREIRRKRSLTEDFESAKARWNDYPGVSYAGGDRAVVYEALENMAHRFGVNGKSCLLRTICELHEAPLLNHGLFGEILEMLLSPSLAAFAEVRLPEYIEAELHGRRERNCKRYKDACEHTLFSDKLMYKRPHPNALSSSASHTFRNQSVHHRRKRFIFFGPSRRILFPPSTTLVGTPTLNLPFMRELPEGYSSQLSYSIPLKFNFDDLGLTSVLNLFGQIPFLNLRKKRSVSYSGGDREMVYAVLADALQNVGMNGEMCLLRAICEANEKPLENHGLFGELFHLFLTPSLSTNNAKRLHNFMNAEKMGKDCGECSSYYAQCPYSAFSNPAPSPKHGNEEDALACRQKYFKEYDVGGFVDEYKSTFTGKSSNFETNSL